MLIVRSSKGRRPYGSLALSVPLALVASLVLAGVLLVLWSESADAQTTFTVNKTGDAGDRTINGVCDSSRKRGKQCTLRAAIQESNATPGADTINFNIGGTASVKTISPASPLPEITAPVTMDGYTQRGAKENTLTEGNDAVLKIQLNGEGAGADAVGLTITTSTSTIRGLVINLFDGDGVEIAGPGATDNKIEGNFIGTNAGGTADLGNGISGVDIRTASDTTIGGTASAARNVISGNNFRGLHINGSGETGNEVLGNYIGTDKHGSGALGNTNDGVLIQAAEDTAIGGTASGAGNVISGNGGSGVHISGAAAAANKVEGNFIGTKADGTVGPGNGLDGVSIISAPNNTIGGTAREAGNIISGNTLDGVDIRSGTGNRLLSNRIFSNGELGIDLDGGTEDANGVTANDLNDPDTGPNRLQNFPVITSVIQSSSFFNPTRVSGTLNSTPSQNFTVQCFLASEIPEDADDSGHGEGKFFMAEDTTVTTDANGDASFECDDFPFPVSLEGKRWSATATDEATGDTSEFSANFPG